MEGIKRWMTEIALNPAYHDYLAIAKGARNGLVYGAKIRFPHALVMTFLFGRGTPQQKIQNIFRATKQHSMNLCKFVSIYKTLLLIQKKLNGGKPRSIDTFLAGLIGGWWVFGERNAVNEQIVLYACSRCVSSLLPRAEVPPNYPPGKVIPPNSRAFEIYAALNWAFVMWLFTERRSSLQGGLVNSMDYLYVHSDTWDSLRNLFWHNV